ncbi:MAG: hypothetical protein ACYCW6_22305 [Candidatus Xenobia bacterium]
MDIRRINPEAVIRAWKDPDAAAAADHPAGAMHLDSVSSLDGGPHRTAQENLEFHALLYNVPARLLALIAASAFNRG